MLMVTSSFGKAIRFQNNKSDSNLFTYVLPFHYNVPSYNIDYQILVYRRYNYKVEAFFDLKVDAAIKGLNSLTNGKIPELHVVNSISDDFGYADAGFTFEELKRFNKILIETGNSIGYNTKIVYSTLYDYFKILKSQNFTYGQFKGDFLPYQETYNGNTEYWSGYYSTKIYLKRQIVHLYNEIQTTKLLLANRVLNRYHTIVGLDKTVCKDLDSINEKILKAEKQFSVTLHHDGITGTNKRYVADDYIRMTHEGMNNLTAAREEILTFNQAMHQDTIDEMQHIVSELDDLEVFHYTVVNPNGYQRDEIMNITLPNSEDDANYAFVIQHSFESKIYTNVTAYKVDLYNLDNEDKKPKVETKAFVKISVPALGDTQVYLLKFSGDQQKCTEAGIR